MAARRSRGGREHFGRGRLAINPDKAVFINCPFDPEFEPTFDAIAFTTVCCGFLPRSALESGSVAVPRMERIVQAIFSSKYSIHDLSRCRGEGDQNLARFNMPLELGMAMARRYVAEDQHDWLLLVPEGHVYLQFVSDMAGFDPVRYDSTAESLVPKLMAGWPPAPMQSGRRPPRRFWRPCPSSVSKRHAWSRSGVATSLGSTSSSPRSTPPLRSSDSSDGREKPTATLDYADAFPAGEPAQAAYEP